MTTDKTLKEAILGYMTVLNVKEFQDQLLPAERQIGSKNIMGCLYAIEDKLLEQFDPVSDSLIDIINRREKLNGRISDINNSELVASTKYCAEQLFNYYIERYR